MTTPKLPLTRQQTSNGHIWRQSDGSVFSFAEHAEWVWERLTRANMYDAIEAHIDNHIEELCAEGKTP